MALPQTAEDSWFGGFDRPSRWAGIEREYELYQDDDAFVLRLELPGYEEDEIRVAWDEGVLNVAAEHEDDEWSRQRTYHRRFRFPRQIIDEESTVRYHNGILEVRLPLEAETFLTGRQIEGES